MYEPTVVAGAFRAPAEWDGLIGEMVEFGASGADGQFARLTAYLPKNCGKVNVNAD